MADTLFVCHERLAKLLGSNVEGVEVLRRADEHRAYWRPEHVRVVLLAESHVFTTPQELALTIASPPTAPPDLPRGFVRLVYCLGYGENHLLNRPIQVPINSGTPQFWKILYSCANPISSNADFAPIQTSTTSSAERVANKIALLLRLRDLGVWLLDASPAALYAPGRPKPSAATLAKCIRIGWDFHVRYAVERAAPSHIVCVGLGVGEVLASRLSMLGGADVTVIPQPNARLSSAEHHRSFLSYRRVVLAAMEA